MVWVATDDAAPRRDDVFVFFTVVVRFFDAPPLLLGFDLALLAPRLAGLQVALDAARAFEVADDFLAVDLERARVLREVDRDEEARRRVLGAGRLAEADLARPVALAAVLALTIEDLDLELVDALLLGFDLALLAPRLAGLQVALGAARAFEVAVDFLTVDLERVRVPREVDSDEEARRRVLGAGRLAKADLARPVALAAVLALTIEDLDLELVDFLLADGAMMRLRRR